MNSQPATLAIPTPSEQTAGVNSGGPPTQCSINPSLPQPTDPVHPAFRSGRRGNGKIARLPKSVRDQINNWILDGVSYPDIIQRLGEHAKDLNPSHLCQWKKRGHQDWLLEREWLGRLSSKAEFSSDILAAPNSASLHEAGLRIAASQMFDQLMRFTAVSPDLPDADKNSAQSEARPGSGQPEIFARLVNALSRLTREALAFQKYRDAAARDTSKSVPRKDPDRDISDNEFSFVMDKWDQAFRRRSATVAGSSPAAIPAPELPPKHGVPADTLANQTVPAPPIAPPSSHGNGHTPPMQ